MKKPKLVCMAFDGDTQTERPVFESTDEAWEYADELGSKWYFYPFHFVITESGKTIRETPDGLEFLSGRRLSAVVGMFSETAALPEAQNVGVWEFQRLIQERYL